MATAAEIRQSVAQGNANIERAQEALRLAQSQLVDAIVSYMSVDSRHLDGVMKQLYMTQTQVDQALNAAQGIVDTANAYAQQV